MAQAEYSEVLPVEFKKLFLTITNYEDYPNFVDGCQGAKVLKSEGGVIRVKYDVSVMSKDISYTLDHKQDPKTGSVEWSLVESSFFKKNTGSWTLKKQADGKTAVTYALEIEFNISVPGFILNRLVKGSLPGMVKSFAQRAEKNGG